MAKKVVSQTLFVNLFAGPGTGKSTMMAHIFAELKWLGINCELVDEYVKGKVWEESFNILSCQPLVFGKQYAKLFKLNGKVDVVITDSPILLSPIYDKAKSKHFLNYVLERHNDFWNTNIFLVRKKKYNPKGRTQKTVGEAKKIDVKVLNMLKKLKVRYRTFTAERESVEKIVDFIVWMIDKKHTHRA